MSTSTCLRGAVRTGALLAAAAMIVGAGLSMAMASDSADTAVVREPTEPQVSFAASAGGRPRGLDVTTAARDVVGRLGESAGVRALTATSDALGRQAVVTMDGDVNDVERSWKAGLAVGALAELTRTRETVASQVFSSAVAVGLEGDGRRTKALLGVGAVRLGQVFGSPADDALRARIDEAASRFGLKVTDVSLLHPLETAMAVKLTIPDGTTTT